jgi:hypothetical protein
MGWCVLLQSQQFGNSFFFSPPSIFSLHFLKFMPCQSKIKFVLPFILSFNYDYFSFDWSFFVLGSF